MADELGCWKLAGQVEEWEDQQSWGDTSQTETLSDLASSPQGQDGAKGDRGEDGEPGQPVSDQ